ncbi:MAG: type III-B CRISPR module RAMP protein Cmr6 [Bacteroidota bacterium]
MIKQPNYGWKFYRDYFNDVDFKISDKKSQEEIFKPKNKKFERAILIPLVSNGVPFHSFTLKLLYPGLVSGVGYQMGIGMVGEFKIGFYFDHTTGMPVIPGSSIKGVIRSIFPSFQDEKEEAKLKRKSKNDDQKARFIWNLICDLKGIDNASFSKKDEKSRLNENERKIIRQIELEIFEGRKIKIETELKKASKEFQGEEYSGIYKSDIFFDSYIELPVDHGLTKDRIFGTDSVTPHGTNPLKSPVPLLFLKVLSGTTWRFCFNLNNGLHLTAEQKLELFRQLILNLGIGAKTNVGYGQFE